jgi:L-iditol 2-dehydrogenase
MKSIGLYGKKHLVVESRELNIEAPGFNDVIVKIHACGVCGTDINFLTQWTGDAMPLGHEIAGEVIETGEGVKDFKQGDRVIVEDCSMCGTCVNCKNGRSDLCINMFGLDGQSGMGQYIRVRYTNLVKFEGLDYINACLTEPLAVSLNSVLLADIPLNGSVAVIGCGPLGLMSAGIAKLRGAGFVAVSEINTNSRLGKARIKMAEKLGADMVINSREENIEKVIKDKYPGGIDRVIVSAPPESINDALKIISYGGIITFYGLHFGGRNMVNIDINNLIFKKVTLRPCFAEPAVNFNTSLELIKKNLIPVDEIITHKFVSKDAKAGLHAIIEGSEPVIKAVVLPDS